MEKENKNKIKIFNVEFDLKWVSLFTMVFQNTLLVLLMRYSRVPVAVSGDMLYLTSTAVVMSEVFKLIISLIGMYDENRSAKMKKSYVDYVSEELFHFDTVKLMVPGLLYVLQNNLLFVALSHLDPATYQVTYQLKILTTALFSVFLLNKKLTKLQILSLVILFVGVSLVQLQMSGDSAKDKKQDDLIGLICVLLACLSSGFAGVYFEKILKGSSSKSLYVRNMQLAMFGVTLGTILVLLNDSAKVFEHGFFQGYTHLVWTVIFVQAISGFVIASVMKYADNILKGFATAISIILSAYVSQFIFDFVISLKFFIGAFLVVVSVFLYGYTPPPKKPIQPRQPLDHKV